MSCHPHPISNTVLKPDQVSGWGINTIMKEVQYVYFTENSLLVLCLITMLIKLNKPNIKN